jgi:hypothetical protein
MADEQMLPRPQHLPHIVTPEEARRWLHRSAIERITFHRTDAVAARHIVADGVIIPTDGLQPAWGFGFYSSTRPDPQYGDTEVRVAVRLVSPLVLPDTVSGAEGMDNLLAEAGTEDTRAALLAAGYDGVVLHLQHGEIWVVAYHPDQVKIVRERRDDR